jgi:hypothetical protein
MSQRRGGFSEAANRLCRRLSGEENIEFGTSHLMILQMELKKIILGLRAGWVQPADIEDLSQQALTRFADACRKRRVDCASADAYLATTCENLVRGQLRQRLVAAPGELGDLSNLADVDALEAIEQRVDVERALEEMEGGGHLTCVRVVTAFRDLADLAAAAPSLREVARVAGVSAPTVRDCLERFRTYLTK